jgi:hypothetical protein
VCKVLPENSGKNLNPLQLCNLIMYDNNPSQHNDSHNPTLEHNMVSKQVGSSDLATKRIAVTSHDMG